MTATAPLAILLGAGIGIGIFLLVRGLTPAPPALGRALDQMHPIPRRRPLHAHLARLLPPPAAELRLLGQTTQRYAIEKATYTLGGLLAPDAIVVALRALGVGVPLLVPTLAGLAAAAVMFVVADLNIKQRAAQAREEFRRSIAAYLTLVGLVRFSGSGAVESLESAANVGGGWVFERIREALDDARYANEAPWERLRRVSVEIGVPDLGEVGDIMSLAGDQGAQVYRTLLARAQSLRVALRTREQAKAAAATTLMYVPTVLLLFAFLILIGYPAYRRIAG